MVFCALSIASPWVAHAASDVVYTQNNIFVAEQVSRGEIIYKASYSGWVDPRPPFSILPAGSKVTVGTSRHGFSLLIANGLVDLTEGMPAVAVLLILMIIV